MFYMIYSTFSAFGVKIANRYGDLYEHKEKVFYFKRHSWPLYLHC